MMPYLRVVTPIAIVAGLALAFRAYGWPGVALAGGGVVMWLLLHYSRAMGILGRAARNPLGSVGSTVMLHARLERGMPLLMVVARTQSLGQMVSPEGVQPEIFRWSDASQSSVSCEFEHGRLVRWQLHRPQAQIPAPDVAHGAPDAALPP